MPIAVIATIAQIYAGVASAMIGRRALTAVSAVRRGPASNAVFYLVLACVIAFVGSVSIVAFHSATTLLLLLWLVLVSGAVAITLLKRFRYDENEGLSSNAADTATVAQLAAIGRVISNSLSIDDVWEELADLIGALIPYDRISVATYDPVGEAWTYACIRGVEVSGWGVGDVVPASMSIGSPTPADRNGKLIRTRSRGITSGERLAHEPAIEAGLVSGITVPLISNNVVVGGLTLRSGQPEAYSADDLELLGHVADQIAGAIQNFELRAALERGAMERKAIAEIGRVISSSLDTEEVYERFASEVRTIIPSDRIAICLVDAEAETFSTAYVSESHPSDQDRGDRTPLEGTIVAEALRQNSGIVVRPDAPSKGARPLRGPGDATNNGTLSSIAVPFTVGSGTAGVLTVQSSPGNVYTEAHLSLAERVGSQIAGAIANSKLHAEIAEQVREREAIAEIGRVISSSLEITTVYERFALAFRQLIPCDMLTISEVDLESRKLTVLYNAGARVPGREPGDRLDTTGTLAEEVARTRASVVVQGGPRAIVARYPQIAPAIGSGLKSFLAVPLIHIDAAIGVLQAHKKVPNGYTAAHRELAERVSNQIAGAVANSRLYSDLNLAQEALKSSERRYRSLVESGSDVVYTADKRGRFTFADPAVERLTGYGPKELEGRHFTFLIRPDWVKRAQRHYADQVRRAVPETTFQLPIVTKSGQAKWVEQTVTLLDDDQEPSGLHGVVRDITDRKAAQEALVKGAAAEARSEALRRARQRVVVAQESIRRNIAQQLHGTVQNRLILLLHRLAGVIGSAPDEAPNPELQAIQSDLQGVLEHDIRDISRQLYPAILRQGIVPAVQSLADQFESIVPVGLELDRDLVEREGSDRGLIHESIRLALYRVAEEALNNVAKHADATEVAVTLGLDKDTGSLRLSVRDDGRGFDVTSMTASVGVAGMGDYADTMGGECEVRSVPGEGTMVEAVFPISEPLAASASRDGPSG